VPACNSRVVASSGQMRLGRQWAGVAEMMSYETVASKEANTETEEFIVLGAVIRQRLVKTEVLEFAVVNFKVMRI
jgi:hypothetical protein